MQNPSPHDPRYIDWLVKIAEENRGKGIIEEPRLFWDVVTLNDSGPLVTPFTGEVYQNGEQFPVRLTHAIFALRPTWGADPDGDDERLIQRVSARLRFYDTFYQNNLLLPCPLWMNKVVATSAPTSLGSAHWIPDRPIILSARDTLRIDYQPEEDAFQTGDGDYIIAATVTGVGLLSKRPYLLGSSATLPDTTTARTNFSTQDFKNDGTEPIAITDVGFMLSSGANAASIAGDIRKARFNITQINNGTARPWAIGPVGEALAPGQLWAISQGRTIVHRFPGDGIIWEPGEGMTAEVAALTDDTEGLDMMVGLAGYIQVK